MKVPNHLASQEFNEANQSQNPDLSGQRPAKSATDEELQLKLS